MGMTPQDIQNQKFNTKFRGFDVDEVDSFLEEVAENFLALIQENKKLKGEAQALQQNNEQFASEEKAFKAALVSAQKIAEEMKEKSKKDADELRKKSKKDADEILAKAREEIEKSQSAAAGELSKIQEELEELKTIRTKVRDELRGTLTTYLKLLDEAGQPGKSGSEVASSNLIMEEAVASEIEETEILNEETPTESVDDSPPDESESGSSSSDDLIKDEEKQEEKAPEEDGLDEETLAELFQESEGPLTDDDEEIKGRATDDEDLSDLFETMELPDVSDEEKTSESTLAELSEDLLFSEHAPDEEEKSKKN